MYIAIPSGGGDGSVSARIYKGTFKEVAKKLAEEHCQYESEKENLNNWMEKALRVSNITQLERFVEEIIEDWQGYSTDIDIGVLEED